MRPWRTHRAVLAVQPGADTHSAVIPESTPPPPDDAPSLEDPADRRGPRSRGRASTQLRSHMSLTTRPHLAPPFISLIPALKAGVPFASAIPFPDASDGAAEL